MRQKDAYSPRRRLPPRSARRHEPPRLPYGSRRLRPVDAAVDPRQAPRPQRRMPSRLRRCRCAWRRSDRHRAAARDRRYGGIRRPDRGGFPRPRLSCRPSSLSRQTICGASLASLLSAKWPGYRSSRPTDVLYHLPERRPLQDVLTCICEGCTIGEAGYRLAANAERHLKLPEEMARLFRGHEDAVERTLTKSSNAAVSPSTSCTTNIPRSPVPEGMTPQQRLAELAWQGAAERFFGEPLSAFGGRGGARSPPSPPPLAGEGIGRGLGG